MRRISTATRVANKFGAGKDGFTNGDAVGGIAATDLEDVWFDHVQEEIANVVEGAGLTLDTSNRAQLLAAIQAMFAPVVGSARNVKMALAAASASGTLTADEITVGTALGGKKFLLANFNKTVNLATTGAGGMDTGVAPVSGFVALYAIYNPTTGASALLATNATAAAQPNVYGGANMPSGYTASALISVWPTNSSSQLIPGVQCDRSFMGGASVVLTTSTQQAAVTALPISSAVPKNARKISGSQQVGNTASAAVSTGTLYVSPTGGGNITNSNNTPGASIIASAFSGLLLTAQQTLYYTATTTTGTLSYLILINGYEF